MSGIDSLSASFAQIFCPSHSSASRTSDDAATTVCHAIKPAAFVVFYIRESP